MSTGDPCYKCRGKSFIQLDNYTWVPCPVCNNYGSWFFGGCPNCRDKDAELAALRAELAQERERNRWIPCSERLPEDREHVMVRWRERIDCNQTYRAKNGWGDEYANKHIHHWRPLPPPPEEPQP